jgi:CRP/FNR family cyclic AMP-dependent transcriptional regulator
VSDQKPKAITVIKDRLIDLPFFNKFGSAELDVLAHKMELRNVKVKEYVFTEGDPGTYMGFVAKGEIAVIKESKQGKLKRLAFIKKGFTFGEMALVDTFPRSASIIARLPSELLILSQEKLEALCEQHPKIALKIMQGISRLLSLHLRRTSGELSDFIGQ